MSRIICMIPARLGSKRIKYKNLRYLANKPLICHVLETVKATNLFDDIYINSEADVFAEFCKEYDVKFYKRSKELASDDITNDKFIYDFLLNTELH